MALLIDKSFRPGHSFNGTRQSDEMIGNGTATLFGGAGDDNLNPGINHGPARISVYGGWAREDVPHPADGLKVGSQNWWDDGDDVLHFGSHILAAGGNGENRYVWHGPGMEAWNRPGEIRGFNVENDTLIVPHDEGFRFGRMWVSSTRDDDGDKVVTLTKMEVVAMTKVPGTVEAHFILGVQDDGRERDFEPTEIEWSGRSYRDDVIRWFHAEVDIL
ncbi:hypothetical protein CNY89_00145 [Amaricoccus sp. HAR-UPW-R2A-40]|nr:hypothetical protein CNY89_00145 [Amaricoccus sp. HAR-UPW-R2A-40]